MVEATCCEPMYTWFELLSSAVQRVWQAVRTVGLLPSVFHVPKSPHLREQLIVTERS